jgi:hypothetical protein
MYHKHHEWVIDNIIHRERIYENANNFPHNVRIPLTGSITVHK